MNDFEIAIFDIGNFLEVERMKDIQELHSSFHYNKIIRTTCMSEFYMNL